MKYIHASLALVIALFLSGCATRYQKIGTDATGGYSSSRIAENRFKVSFHANGFTKPNVAYDYAFLRAAELTLEYRFTHFVIDGEASDGSTTVAHMGSTTNTTGYISPYGGYSGTSYTTNNSVPIFKPGYVIAITCFEGVPSGRYGKVYDADSVVRELKTKYKIK